MVNGKPNPAIDVSNLFLEPFIKPNTNSIGTNGKVMNLKATIETRKGVAHINCDLKTVRR